MMRRMDAALVAIAAILVPIALAASGCARTPTASATGGTITLALRDSFATFDPAFAWDPEQTPYLRLVYEGLVAFDDSGRVVPACAERWQVSEGGRTIRFELRRGLRDASGAAIGAEDFARGFARLFRPGALRSPARSSRGRAAPRRSASRRPTRARSCCAWRGPIRSCSRSSRNRATRCPPPTA